MPKSLRYVRVYGDRAILWFWLRNPMWKEIRTILANRNHTWANIKLCLFTDALSFLTELFAGSLRMFLRLKQGRFTYGLIVYLMSLLLMIFWNTEKSFSAYYQCIKSIYLGTWGLLSGNGADWSTLYAELIQPASRSMELFMYAYVVFGLVKLFGMYFLGWKNKTDPYDRGMSVSYLLFRKVTNRLGTSFYKAVWEPLVVFLIGIFSYSYDPTFSLFLIISSCCLFIQEGLDANMRDTYNP